MKAKTNLISTLLGVALLAMPITAAAGSAEYEGDRFTLPLAQTYASRANSRANLTLIHDRDDWHRRHQRNWRWGDRDDWYEHNRSYRHYRDDWRQRYYAPIYRDDDCRVGRRYYLYRDRYWQRDF
jgi:hypothetical protein